MTSRQTGRVKKWVPGRAFGFIAPDGGEPDQFVHISQCGGVALVRGQRVEFGIGQNRAGLDMAVDVRILNDEVKQDAGDETVFAL
jgi:cold shock protein